MTREIITISLKAEIFKKYDNKCYICGYLLKPALRVHHIVPVSLGGTDNAENLILLCGNCHTLTHFYSSRKYENKEIGSLLSEELALESQEKIKNLIAKIQQAKNDVEENKNLWIKNGVSNQVAYSLREAVESIANKNKFTADKKTQLAKSLELILKYMPDNICAKSSYRLLDRGRCISINLMNYLIFRSPAYGDLGEKPKYDCYIIFPSEIDEIQSAKHETHKSSWKFKNLKCISLHLSYSDLIAFDENDWLLFKQACEMANNAQKTRSWVSNIDVR